MSDPQRREFLAAAAAIATLATLAGAQPAIAGDPSFMNNVPDLDLSGKDLPTFKFALEKSQGKVIGNSSGKEATVTQLPISKGLAGVSMRLEPGTMRELHWHATAAEWAFVIEGRVRTTVIDPGALRTLHWHPNADEWQYVIDGSVSVTLFGSHGRTRTEQLQQGDVGYIPQGYGHSIENVGNRTARILIGFNAGVMRPSTSRNGSRQTPPTCWPPISASRRSCSRNFRSVTCLSPAGVNPANRFAARRICI